MRRRIRERSVPVRARGADAQPSGKYEAAAEMFNVGGQSLAAALIT
jgi:hypothetical protein